MVKVGKKFKLYGYSGTYKVVSVSPRGWSATAVSDTGGKATLVKNKPTGQWRALVNHNYSKVLIPKWKK